MTRMKKAALAAALILPALLLLAGCVRFDITCGIDGSGRAVLRYDGVLTTAALRPQDREPAAEALEELLDHFRGQGFSVTGGPGDDDPWRFSAVRTQACDTAAQAAQTLREWITDESLSPFHSAGLLWTDTGYEQAGYLTVTLDLTRLLTQPDPDLYPPDIAALYRRGLESSRGTLTLMLPGDRLLAAQGDAAGGEGVYLCAAPLDLDAPVRLSLMTGLAGDDPEARLAAAREEALRTRRWIVPAAAGVAAGLLAMGALYLVWRRRSSG